jgi:acyl carrier protein
MNDDVRAVVMSIASEVFEIEPGELQEDQHLEDDLGTTSVMRLDFLVSLERRLGLQFDVAEAERAMRLSEVIAVVQKYVDGKRSA